MLGTVPGGEYNMTTSWVPVRNPEVDRKGPSIGSLSPCLIAIDLPPPLQS